MSDFSEAASMAAQDIMDVMGEMGSYHPFGWLPGKPVPFACRVARVNNSTLFPGGYESATVSGRTYLGVLVSEVAAPQRGDTVTLDGRAWTVDGIEASLSDEYLWTLAVR